MEEKELKTSTGQRIAIALIAIVMVGTILASYIAIVVNGNKNDSNTIVGDISTERVLEYEDAYNEALAEFEKVSKSNYDDFMKYRSEVKAYNEDVANTGGIATRDLKSGSGAEITSGDTNYLAYYIGWCADETIFDSSLNSGETAFKSALDPSGGLIEGWNKGVVGMKRGGIREITIPGELAYGETRTLCGGTNKPLKFIVMAVANEDPLKTISEDLDFANMKLQYAYYGIDYDRQMTSSATTD